MTSGVTDVRRTSVRLGLQTGLLVVGVLAVVGLLLFAIYERAADEAASLTLSDTTANIDAPNEAPPGVHVVVVTPAGRNESAGMPSGFPDEKAIALVTREGGVRQEDRTVGGRQYTVRTARVGDRVTQAVLDRHEINEERSRILTSLLTAGGVGVLLAALVAAWLARRAMSPLTQSLSMQRRFVADASHELRTPLTLLSTRLQMVARRARQGDDPLTGRDLDGVLADTGRLTEILDDLLIAADPRGEADRGDVDLGSLVSECVEAASGSADQAGVGLHLQAAPHVVVEGVAPALRRAVTALLDNALDHAGSRVDVSVEERPRVVRVVVADDGPGIPEEVRPRLFERFTSTRTTEDAGGRRHYGIGLALVADVAAAHDGSVEANGRGDGEPGAVLTLTLPTSASPVRRSRWRLRTRRSFTRH
jgi:signal transduction histidine kinase